MGHGARALLATTEGLLGLEGVGLLEVADLCRYALAGGGAGGKDAGEVCVVVSADDLGRERVMREAQVLADVLLDAWDAMGAAHAEGVPLLEGTPLADLPQPGAIVQEDVDGLGELVAEGRVAQV